MFIKHVLPFGLCVRETTEFIQNGDKCIVKTRFSEIDTSGVLVKYWSALLEKGRDITEGMTVVLDSIASLADELTKFKRNKLLKIGINLSAIE